MSKNNITLKNENGKKTVYDVLMTISSDNFEYVIYTNNKKDSDGALISYFGKYEVGSSIFKNVNKKEEEGLKLILSKFRSK
ncbi:MAG: hypothetical protein R3Y13_00660 [bacterium]